MKKILESVILYLKETDWRETGKNLTTAFSTILLTVLISVTLSMYLTARFLDTYFKEIELMSSVRRAKQPAFKEASEKTAADTNLRYVLLNEADQATLKNMIQEWRKDEDQDGDPDVIDLCSGTVPAPRETDGKGCSTEQVFDSGCQPVRWIDDVDPNDKPIKRVELKCQAGTVYCQHDGSVYFDCQLYLG